MRRGITVGIALLAVMAADPSNAAEYPWLTHAATRTVATVFDPPAGFVRVRAESGSFADWLRHLPLERGDARLVLYDGRPESPTRGTVEDLTLTSPPAQDPSPVLLKIPAGVVHGFTAIHGEEARIINIPTLPYRYAAPDEYRYPWNSPEIPYRWPAEVTRGG